MSALDAAERAALCELAASLGATIDSERMRAAAERGGAPDPELHRQLAETGLLGLELPEELGGGGANFDDLALVLEELGARAATSHVLSSAVLFAGALLRAGSPEQQERWLPGVASGELCGTVALTGRYAAGSPQWPTARRVGDGWEVDGVARHVLDAAWSARCVVPAATDHGLVVSVVNLAAPGCSVIPLQMTDATRSLADVELKSVAVGDGDVIAVGGPAEELVSDLADRAAAAVAMDSVGVARRVLAMTVEYLSQREQFGRPIGSFQAVKHQAADLLVDAEVAKGLVREAVELVATGDERRSHVASMAKELACGRAAHGVGVALQLHGGIGYTWEHDLHVFFKRAQLNEHLSGDGGWHRRRVANALMGQ